MTELQLETLRLIEAGKVCNVRFGNGAWRIRGANPSAVGRLMQIMKLAEQGPIVIGAKDYYPIVLTELGRAALSKVSHP